MEDVKRLYIMVEVELLDATYMTLKYMLSVTVEVIQDANVGARVHNDLPCCVCQIQHRNISVQSKRPDYVLKK